MPGPLCRTGLAGQQIRPKDLAQLVRCAALFRARRLTGRGSPTLPVRSKPSATQILAIDFLRAGVKVCGAPKSLGAFGSVRFDDYQLPCIARHLTRLAADEAALLLKEDDHQARSTCTRLQSLVSRPRGSWRKSRSAAPGWQGAR